MKYVLLIAFIFSAGTQAKVKIQEVCKTPSKEILAKRSYAWRTNAQNPVLNDVTFNFGPHPNQLLIPASEKCVKRGNCRACKVGFGDLKEVLVEQPVHVEKALANVVGECWQEARRNGLVERARDNFMETCPAQNLKFVSERFYIQCDGDDVEKELAEAFDFSTACNAALARVVPKFPKVQTVEIKDEKSQADGAR